jgi:nucleoside-triphosphatase THEP1
MSSIAKRKNPNVSGAEQQQSIFLITGNTQGGKTSYLTELVKLLGKSGLSVGGFLAPGSFESGERSGFKLNNIISGVEIPLASTKETAAWIKYRRFWFNADAFIRGREWIQACLEQQTGIVVIDEVGPMELEGMGWSETLELLKGSSGPVQLWSVRENLAEEVKQRWDIPVSHIIRIDEVEVNQAVDRISIETNK